jgi:tripartite-type tricarboxylate transporter receptor subunit TctC
MNRSHRSPAGTRSVHPAIALASAIVAIPGAIAQSYPQKTVTVIVPFSPGAATDILARAASQKLSEYLGQQFIVVNRDGATGAIGTELAARAAPDGHTLLWGSSGPMSINPVYSAKLPYDPLRDFAPIGLFNLIPYVLVVHPSVPARSAQELIALARARPGKLNFASSGQGGAPHLAGELLKTMARVDIVHIPYKGTTLFMSDLASGQVDLAFTGAASSLGYIQAGKLRPLAVSGLKRSPLFPDLPTLDQSGLPGYEIVVWYGLLAPARTSGEIVTTLNVALNRALTDTDIRRRIAHEGAYPVGGTTDQFGAFLKDQLARYASMIRNAGLKRE